MSGLQRPPFFYFRRDRNVIELRETDVGELIKRGFLRSEDQKEPEAVRKALYLFLDRAVEATLWWSAVAVGVLSSDISEPPVHKTSQTNL